MEHVEPTLQPEPPLPNEQPPQEEEHVRLLKVPPTNDNDAEGEGIEQTSPPEADRSVPFFKATDQAQCK